MTLYHKDPRRNQFITALQQFKKTAYESDKKNGYDHPAGNPVYQGVTSAWLHILFDKLDPDDPTVDRAIQSILDNTKQIIDDDFIRDLNKNND
jgi:hypothetical protein